MKRKILRFVMLVGIIVLAETFGSSVTAYANNAKAPTINSKGSVKYSYVYFGSYPQREVISSADSTQKAALQSRGVKSYKAVSSKTWSNIVNAKYNSNGDATVGGVKYRRIKMTDATQSQTDTPQLYRWVDSTSYHYFIYEPIKWRVLEISKGKALLLSEYALDDEKYNDTKAASLMWYINWKNSTIRSWLNGYSASKNACKENFTHDNFIDAAFSAAQQKKIIGNKLSGNIRDKVFMLSVDDVYNTTVSAERGFVSSDYRKCRCTTYGYAKGIWREELSDKTGVMWWLYTDDAGDMAPHVTYFGDVDSDGRNNNKDALGVRPAIKVSRSTLKSLKTAK